MSFDPIVLSFERTVRRDPLAPLVVSPERRATTGAVDALARAAGQVLDEARLPPGVAVGLMAANGPGFLASFLALRRAGLVALLLDAQTPESEALRIVRALGAAALLRCRTGWPTGPEDWTLTPAAAGEETPLVREGTAVIKLTSGSTGLPRGIATPAEALIADDANLTATMGIRPDDRLLTTIPLSHSYGLSSLTLPALLRGALLISPEAGSLFDPFVAAEQAGATVFPAVPAYLDALLRLSEPPPRPSALRLVLTAGAVLGPATAGRFRETFGLPVHVFYGASECGGICYDRVGDAGERGTVGTPVEGVQVVLEGEGVVTVRSAAVASGYLPEADPERLSGGRFVGGDLGGWENGELVLRARLDDLVNIKGKKVNPREVEEVIGALSGVDEVVVLGVPVPGRSGERLRAVIACAAGRLTVDQVLAWSRERL
ncbi:MAG TPA: class I adenylate-forming enzyme family protein, partial [Thermoanaerobaculia bacterium]|nr:class I adenylate-forming enzyme family protein [Thermoanaerobaculia bacterium]